MNHGGSKQVVVCENISRPRCQEGIRGNSAASPPDGPCGQPGENAEKPSLLEWWAEQGSNLRPRPCKGRALPAELSARAWILADLSLPVNLSMRTGVLARGRDFW